MATMWILQAWNEDGETHECSFTTYHDVVQAQELLIWATRESNPMFFSTIIERGEA